MSAALSEASTPAQDSSGAGLEHHLIDPAVQSGHNSSDNQPRTKQRRSSPIPRIRRACTACHTGKTRCSEVLPCQNCLKKGLGATCAYPEPDAGDIQQHAAAVAGMQALNNGAGPSYPGYPQLSTMPAPYYSYDYTAAAQPSTSAFRSAKRPRNLTEEEAAAITRNFQRGDFYVGTTAPVRIDPRLPVRLTLGEGDHVHFTIGEALG